MLKVNVQDQLINGQMEEVTHMIFQGNAVTYLYVQFSDPQAG